MTLISAIVLALQAIIDIIVYCICRYIDYFKLAIELDKNKGSITKFIFRKEIKANKLEKKVYKKQGESIYTKRELRMIESLEKEAKIYKNKKKEAVNNSIKNSRIQIRDMLKKELTENVKIRIDKKYNSFVNEASSLLLDKIKLDNILNSAHKTFEKLSKDKNREIFNYIPVLISLVENYVNQKYVNVSKQLILSVIGVIVYIVTKMDVISDYIPKKGYLDEIYLIGKCLDENEGELKKFILWKDNN